MIPTQVDIGPDEVGYAITDSATSTQICAAIAYTFTNNFKCPKEGEFKLITDVKKFGERIAIGELEAILIAVKYLVGLGKKLIILGTDNMNCKHWLEGCPAHDPEIRRILAEIDGTLMLGGARLYNTYIPTLENFSDEPTRQKPLVMSKLARNHVLLDAARAEAAGYWNIGGLRTGGTGNELNLKS